MRKNHLVSYFEQLGKLYKDILVTNALGQTLELEEGLENAIELVLSAHTRGGQIVFIGNGGSAAIASHQAVDYWKNGGIKATAFNDASLLTCLSNDFGYPHVFEKPIAMFLEPFDCLMAISSSGKSKNILRGVQAAQGKECRVITFSGFEKQNPLRKMGAINFYVPSNSYGFVEITHLTLCHCFLDTIIQRKK